MLYGITQRKMKINTASAINLLACLAALLGVLFVFAKYM